MLDGLGQPIDGGPPLTGALVDVDHDAPGPLERQRVRQPLALGVRALDALVPAGRGQRLGLFAGSGVGKSTLLSMIAKGTSAPVIVLSLVGERGREVREFLEDDLGPEGMARSVAVVATSDAPPVVRLRSAFVATRIAEWFRDQGQDVLLLMDSLTRVAMAQREVGLSAGEPPASRGYPPSTFALLPRLLERTGPGATASITGIYTVLVEGDDHNEPIADAARSILDGHVTLDRRLATAGHFPSIDVLESVSRVAPVVTDERQRAGGQALRRLLAAHRDAKELIEVGAYVPGADPRSTPPARCGRRSSSFLQQDRARAHDRRRRPGPALARDRRASCARRGGGRDERPHAGPPAAAAPAPARPGQGRSGAGQRRPAAGRRPRRAAAPRCCTSLQLPDRAEAVTFLAMAAARQSAALAVRDSRELVRLATDGVQDGDRRVVAGPGRGARPRAARAASAGAARARPAQGREQREQDDRSGDPREPAT